MTLVFLAQHGNKLNTWCNNSHCGVTTVTTCITVILYFPIPHNALCLPPKFCINNCCEMLLGDVHIPKSISQQTWGQTECIMGNWKIENRTNQYLRDKKKKERRGKRKQTAVTNITIRFRMVYLTWRFACCNIHPQK